MTYDRPRPAGTSTLEWAGSRFNKDTDIFRDLHARVLALETAERSRRLQPIRFLARLTGKQIADVNTSRGMRRSVTYQWERVFLGQDKLDDRDPEQTSSTEGENPQARAAINIAERNFGTDLHSGIPIPTKAPSSSLVVEMQVRHGTLLGTIPTFYYPLPLLFLCKANVVGGDPGDAENEPTLVYELFDLADRPIGNSPPYMPARRRSNPDRLHLPGEPTIAVGYWYVQNDSKWRIGLWDANEVSATVKCDSPGATERPPFVP